MNQGLVDKAKKTINDCFYLNIASITKAGSPWNTPVYYTFDKNYNFYWISAQNSIHSQNIRSNSEVFITIYPSEESGVGVYIEANAYELSDEAEVRDVLKILDRKGSSNAENVQDYLNGSPLRMYKAIPKNISVSSPDTADKYHGLWVDKRVEIKLI